LKTYQKKTERACRERAEKSDPYVRLARASVENWVRYHERIDVPNGLPEEMLTRRAGAFVSLHRHGRLRGCIGTIMATEENVAEEILQNAVSACSRDPRFSPVTPDELSTLEISVDVLGELESIDFPEKLDVKRYGVVVSHGRKRGLLLPNLDGVDTVEEQIRIARQKGGIREGEPYRLERFEVVRHY
jgi:AmmeMemoRadiSam system protein A